MAWPKENYFTGSEDFELVLVETPYSGDINANLDYLHCCIYDCKRRGEGALATHLLYTTTPFHGHVPDCLPDGMSAGRVWCMNLGIKGWSKAAAKAIFYTDRSMSEGMKNALAYYQKINLPVEFRRFGLTNDELRDYFVNKKENPPLALSCDGELNFNSEF